jgi:hypothetical protein
MPGLRHESDERRRAERRRAIVGPARLDDHRQHVAVAPQHAYDAIN